MAKKQDARRLSPSAQAAIRRQLINYLNKRKTNRTHTQDEAAKIFGLSISAVKQ